MSARWHKEAEARLPVTADSYNQQSHPDKTARWFLRSARPTGFFSLGWSFIILLLSVVFADFLLRQPPPALISHQSNLRAMSFCLARRSVLCNPYLGDVCLLVAAPYTPGGVCVTAGCVQMSGSEAKLSQRSTTSCVWLIAWYHWAVSNSGLWMADQGNTTVCDVLHPQTQITDLI